MPSKKQKEYEIWLGYNELVKGGDPISDKDYSDCTDKYTSIIWNNAAYFKDPNTWESEHVEIEFDPAQKEHVYAVIVYYESGDTFGHSYGNWCVDGVYATAGEAAKIIKNIQYDEDHNGEKKFKSKYKKHKPWRGYFESLENIDLQIFHIV